MNHRVGLTFQKIGVIVMVFSVLCAARVQASLSVMHHAIRLDRFTIPEEQFGGVEAWPETRQFYPKYFKPAATLHLFVRNSGDTPVDIKQLYYNSKPIEQVTVSPTFMGDVIWYRANPETIAPGEFGMIYVRLRRRPEKPVEITVESVDGQKVTAKFNTSHEDKVRLGYVGYNSDITKAYTYVENWTDRKLTVGNVFYDDVDVTAKSEIINGSFEGGPALVEISFDKPQQYGSFHVLKVTTKQGPAAVSQIRLRDDFYYLGMCSGGTGEKYWAKFFNTSYSLGPRYSDKPGWWDTDDNSQVRKYGFRIVGNGLDEATVKAGATVPPGRIIYNGVDEPDASEPANFDYMERSGLNTMRKVEGPMRIQRKYDPYHDTMILIDRTYAPLNWLNYGEQPDIFMNDCYSPTMFMGYDLQVMPFTGQALINAVAPRPAHMMLWATMNTGHSIWRSPTPQENDMSAHYMVGEGLKGLYYFVDWSSYPMESEGGYFIGASKTNMLWKQIGRLNAELSRIGSILAIGFPFQVTKSSDDMLYSRSLLCGKDNFVVVLVNRKHKIYENASRTKQPYIYPVRDATVEIELPKWFKLSSAVEVKWDSVTPVELKRSGSKLVMEVDELMTSKVLVLSRDRNIARKLTLDTERFAALLESEKPEFAPDAGRQIRDRVKENKVISITEEDLAAGELKLDLTDFAVLSKASSIKTVGQLRLEPGKWLGLFPPRDEYGETKIIFVLESKTQLKEVEISLDSQTPNFVACAANEVGISNDGIWYSGDSSFKRLWDGYGSHNPLIAKLENTGKSDGITRFYFRLFMRDPGMVNSDGATNLALSATISLTQ